MNIRKAIILTGLLITAMQVSAAGGNASLTLQKDKSTDLFILNMRDSQGIRSFALVFPTDKLPYSGDLGGCPPSRKIDNVLINEISDFKPSLKAVIVDCRGEETEFEISQPENGIAQVKKIEPPPPPPPPPPPTPTPAVPTTAPEGGVGAPTAAAPSTPANLEYPIKELDGCESAEACKTYCDAPANLERCIAFAETNGLLTKGEIERGKKFAEIVKSGGGPGGCKTEASCKDYCSEVGRLDECVQFAESNGLVSGAELEEMKKIQNAVKRGAKFPGNCTNRAVCELYCKTPEHADECVAFAKEAGFLSEEESKEMEKILPLMRSGQMPGGCSTKESCEAYCEDESHFDECVAFAEKAGLISEKEREIMKKTGGKGPGGCRGRACQTFCENPANQQACFEFGKEYGLISEEDLQRMEEGKQLLRKQLESGPPEIQECLKSVIGEGGLESGGFVGGPELGEKMRECFEKLIPEGVQGQFEFGEGGEFKGPGGCQSREECEDYCKSNPEACGFGGDGGPGGGGAGSSPGGCQSQEECEAYCQEHPDECGGGGGGFPGGPGGYQPPSGGFPTPPPGGSQSGAACPEMLSRASCDAGEERFITYQSEDCGTYFSCRPVSQGSPTPLQQPSTDQYQQDYQKQYEEQYQQQSQPPTNFQPPTELSPGSVYDAFLRLIR
ncbi:MAG: hypothetical protein Q8Q97_00490 [bacterium]|nr:hypothetical protein [bacterium]